MTTAPSVGGASISAAVPTASVDYQHDVVRQTRLLRDSLQSDKIRIGFFLGAGCPSGIYDKDGKKAAPHLPDVQKLTADVRIALEKLDIGKDEAEALTPCWDKLATACKEGGQDSPNIEHVLTELRTLTARRGKSTVDGLKKVRLEELDKAVCDVVVKAVGKPLPPHRCAYHRLASWIGGLQRAAPVDVFTPNYDLLIEEAFEQQRIPHFDGFVGSREPFFDIASIEQDAIPRRWARLWKVHGSINWQRRDDGTVFRAQGPADKGKAMIYPSHLKYDQSRRMPYLAMIDRMRAFFNASGSAHRFGPPVLVVCGYSFADDHLNEVLLDGLRGNQAAHCFALAYEGLDKAKALAGFAAEQPNLTVLAWDGAVVGTRRGLYGALHDSHANGEPWFSTEHAATAGASSDPLVRCRLGDFHYFTLLLEQLYGGRSDVEYASVPA